MDALKKTGDKGSEAPKRRIRLLRWILVFLCVFAVLTLLALPSYISSESFKRLLLSILTLLSLHTHCMSLIKKERDDQ